MGTYKAFFVGAYLELSGLPNITKKSHYKRCPKCLKTAPQSKFCSDCGLELTEFDETNLAWFWDLYKDDQEKYEDQLMDLSRHDDDRTVIKLACNQASDSGDNDMEGTMEITPESRQKMIDNFKARHAEFIEYLSAKVEKAEVKFGAVLHWW